MYYVYKFDGIGIHEEPEIAPKDKSRSIKIEVEPLKKTDSVKELSLEVPNEIKLGSLRK